MAIDVRRWLGLIMGTRMWYPFYSCESDDEKTFEKKVDAVVREIADRGKPKLNTRPRPASESVAEGVPPAPAPAANPKPSSALVSAPAPAPATPPRPPAATAQDQSFTPTMMMSPMAQSVVQHQGSSVGASPGSFAEMTSFFREEREHLETKMEKMREQLTTTLTPPTPKELISAEQLVALQSRLGQIHAAQLLSDDELFVTEDLITDFLELKTDTGGAITGDTVFGGAASQTIDKLHKLVGVSEGLVSDAALARQLRRKFM